MPETEPPVPTPTPTPTPSPSPTEKSAAESILETMLSKQNGDLAAVTRQLLEQTHDLRVKNRDLKASLAELRGKVPPEGAAVLGEDEWEVWNRIKAKGTVADLDRDLEAGRQAMEELAGLRKAKAHQEIAAVHGFKEAVLGKLIEQEQLDITLEEDVKTRKPVAMVKGLDDKGKESKTPLPDYLEKHPVLKLFLPALADTPASPTLGTPPTASPFPPTPAVPARDKNAPSLVNF